MKKIIVLLAFCCTVPALQAQVSGNPTPSVTTRKTTGGDVPDLIVANFNKTVPGVRPSWTDAGNTYMAAYVDSVNTSHIITYDKNGNMLNKQEQQSPSNYPAPIEKYHDSHYPGEKFTVWLHTDAAGNRMYYFTREHETLWFDPNGQVVVEKSANKKVQQP